METRKKIKTEIGGSRRQAASWDQRAEKFEQQMAEVFVKERDLNSQRADIHRQFVNYMGTRSPSVREMGRVRTRPDQPVSAAILKTLTALLDGVQLIGEARFAPQLQVLSREYIQDFRPEGSLHVHKGC